MENKLYLLGWQVLLPGSASKVWEIINYYGSPGAAWRAPDRELEKIPGVRKNTLQNLVSRRKKIDPEQEMEKLNKKGIDFICYYDNNYPERLRSIFDPPPGVFVRGTWKEEQYAAAVVGSRKATHYGLKVAYQLGSELAGAGVAVISGMARGIDTAAHRGALEKGGYTAAVLGCGVDVVYPRENAKMMEEIAFSGALVSEFPPGAGPEPWHFPVRNRVISCLSRMVTVVEAAERSGALITADQALEQGREVGAVPGNVTAKMSRGPNKLIKQGAKLVESAADIIEELGMGCLFPVEELEKSKSEVDLTSEERRVMQVIQSEPVHLDEIINKLELPPGEALSMLMYLELKGMVKQLPGRMFINS